ncbi:VPLPA-CTERM sorting domain-containing protein [Sulfitobacter sp. LCG007]
MRVRQALAIATITAALPMAASAATVGGSFVEGGAYNALKADGVQGDANVITDSGDGMMSYVWSFKALEKLVVSGFGTVNFDFQFVNLAYSYNGQSIDVVPGNPGASTVLFPKLKLSEGDTFDVTISFDSGNRGGDADFALLTEGVQPVPVPAAGLLLLGGLAGFAGLKRRKG